MPAKLLLADDSVTIQRVIELTFADEDIEVTAVGDGDAAIRCLETAPPDIVLADVGMPGRNGYEVAAFVHASPALSHIPVLLLAGAFEPVNEVRARDAGCAGVLVKPFEPQMVIAKVRDLLGPSGRGSAQPEATPGQPPQAEAASPPPPSAPVQPRAASVDDYFDRLDAAFASINATFESPRPAAAQIPAEAEAPAPLPAGPAPDAVAPQAAPAAPLSMADAFGALLGVEQGEPPPLLPDTWAPVVTEDLVEQVARRVADQVGDRVVRELAPEIVTRIAERIVREEIEKLKAEAAAH